MVVDAERTPPGRRRLKLLQPYRAELCHPHGADPRRAIEVQFTRIADPNRVLDEVAMEEDRREKATG